MRVIGESTFSKFTPFIWGFSVHTSSILGSPIHPMLKERWSHETKIAFLSQQDNTLIRSGYNLSFKIQNSRTSAGFIGKTDPYEPLNSIAFYRLYLRYSNRKSTWIVGSYRLQIGEGIIKTNGNPSYLSNPAWANKLEEWNLKEYRGFSRNFPINGIACKFNLARKHQTLVAIGNAQLSGKKVNGSIVTWYKSGLLTDSIKLSQKNNFNCLTGTAAYRYQTKSLSAGLGISSYTFSAPVLFRQPVTTAAAAWYAAIGNDTIGYNSLLTDEYRYLKQLYYPEIWFTHSQKNGNLLFINAVKQIATKIGPASSSSSVLLSTSDNKSSGWNARETKRQLSLTAGWIIPLNNSSDISLRYQHIGSEFESIENWEIQQKKGFNVFQLAMQNSASSSVNITTIYTVQQRIPAYSFQPSPWENSLRCKIHYNQPRFSVKETIKVSRRESNTIENTAFQELEHSLNPMDLDYLENLWQQPNPNRLVQLHTEILFNQQKKISTEFHCYNQLLDNNSSACLEFILNKQWHSSVQTQSGIALYNTNSPIMVQGLQLGSLNSFQMVNKQGILLFCGIRNKPARQLTQLLQLQIMQNFNHNQPLSLRIFAVIWLR